MDISIQSRDVRTKATCTTALIFHAAYIRVLVKKVLNAFLLLYELLNFTLIVINVYMYIIMIAFFICAQGPAGPQGPQGVQGERGIAVSKCININMHQ